MLNNKWTRTAASACMATAMLAGWVMVPASGALAQSPAAAVRGLPDFTDLVEQVGPSVVNIRTVERVRPQSSTPGQGTPDEQMLEFFRRFGIPMPDMGGQGASVASSSAALPMQRKHWVRFP